MIDQWLTALLGKPEEIKGQGRCPPYLYRWRVWGGSVSRGYKSGRAIYIHHFVGNDWSLDLHDHPKRFISIGIKGSYREITKTGDHWYRAPWIRWFPATHAHRIETPPAGCWTLAITLRATREWGFWHDGQWVHWHDYVSGKQSCAE